MSLNWIKVEEYSFNSLLLMERFQLRLLLKAAEQNEKLSEQLGTAREVYACEPVDCLREYLRDKIKNEKISTSFSPEAADFLYFH